MTEPIWVFAEYDWDAVHKLLHECFSYMETRIDPPSSLHKLTPQMIADFAADECLFVIEDNQRPIACIFMTEKPDCLYLGKLAVSPKHRGKGHARTLIERAEQMATDLGLSRLELETRIELHENHTAFAKLGFHKTAETAHDGYSRPTSITMQKELDMTKGHCLCGATSWEYSGDTTWACYCHCDDCRRNCAAPVTAFIGVPLANFKWTGDTPKVYRSSKAVQRHFCDTCGTPMAFQAEHYVGEIHLYAASLESPQEFSPEFHVHYDSKLDWLHIRDDLPKYPHSKT